MVDAIASPRAPVPGGAFLPSVATAEGRRLWSLVDVIEYKPETVYKRLDSLEGRAAQFAARPKQEAISEGDRERLVEEVMEFLADSVAQRVLNERTTEQILMVVIRLGNNEYTASSLAMQLDDLHRALTVDWSAVRFALVPRDSASYFEQPKLFGSAVYDAFPSARADIQEAGNTFATGAHTASVFHLMRAVEIAIRVLARDRRVPLPDEYNLKGWGELIDSIARRVDDINGWLRNPTRVKALSFYQGAVIEARAFKDAWRDHVMHSRRSYDALEAQGAMNHVQAFMQRLAVRLSEHKRTPLLWRGAKMKKAKSGT